MESNCWNRNSNDIGVSNPEYRDRDTRKLANVFMPITAQEDIKEHLRIPSEVSRSVGQPNWDIASRGDGRSDDEQPTWKTGYVGENNYIDRDDGYLMRGSDICVSVVQSCAHTTQILSSVTTDQNVVFPSENNEVNVKSATMQKNLRRAFF